MIPSPKLEGGTISARAPTLVRAAQRASCCRSLCNEACPRDEHTRTPTPPCATKAHAPGAHLPSHALRAGDPTESQPPSSLLPPPLRSYIFPTCYYVVFRKPSPSPPAAVRPDMRSPPSSAPANTAASTRDASSHRQRTPTPPPYLVSVFVQLTSCGNSRRRSGGRGRNRPLPRWRSYGRRGARRGR